MRSCRWLLALLSLFALSASAASLNVGYLSLDVLIPGSPGFPGVNFFTVANLTGDDTAGGFALPPDFPLYMELTLTNSTITIFFDGGPSQLIPLSDLAPGFYTPALLRFSDAITFSKASFSAQLNTTTLRLSDGSVWNAASSNLTADLLPAAGTSLEPGVDLVLLSVDASPATDAVPEPGTWVLVAAPLLALGWFRLLVPRKVGRQ